MAAPRKRPVKECTQCGRVVDAHIWFVPTVQSDMGTMSFGKVVFCTLRCLRAWAAGLAWRNEEAVAS